MTSFSRFTGTNMLPGRPVPRSTSPTSSEPTPTSLPSASSRAAPPNSSIGGKVESYYFGLGADDFYLIADVPSTEAIVAATLTGASHGGLTARTIPLLSPEQIDAAIRISPSYRKPGS